MATVSRVEPISMLQVEAVLQFWGLPASASLMTAMQQVSNFVQASHPAVTPVPPVPAVDPSLPVAPPVPPALPPLPGTPVPPVPPDVPPVPPPVVGQMVLRQGMNSSQVLERQALPLSRLALVSAHMAPGEVELPPSDDELAQLVLQLATPAANAGLHVPSLSQTLLQKSCRWAGVIEPLEELPHPCAPAARNPTIEANTQSNAAVFFFMVQDGNTSAPVRKQGTKAVQEAG
jgi:hypothetical protein